MLVYEQHRVYRSDADRFAGKRSAALVDSTEPLGVFTALNVPNATARPGRSESGRDRLSLYLADIDRRT